MEMTADVAKESFELTKAEWKRITKALRKSTADAFTPKARGIIDLFIDLAEEDFDKCRDRIVAELSELERKSGGAER
jgi:hypothetical protein